MSSICPREALKLPLLPVAGHAREHAKDLRAGIRQGLQHLRLPRQQQLGTLGQALAQGGLEVLLLGCRHGG